MCSHAAREINEVPDELPRTTEEFVTSE